MGPRLVEIITSQDPAIRDRSLEETCGTATLAELLAMCADLEAFRRQSDNLYERVRACFFLHALYRFFIPTRPDLPASGRIPYAGYLHLLERRFEEAIDLFLHAQAEQGP